jgi:type III pantothenate kinase
MNIATSNRTWLIDIGNSTIAFCEKINQSISTPTIIPTSEIQNRFNTLPFHKVDRLIIASVVPQVNPLFNIFPNTFFLNASTVPKIKIGIPTPSELGADRIANALGAYNRFHTACIIIDSGTALTFCYIDKQGTYRGGAILPGLGIATKALHQFTAKIPDIPVAKQQYALGTSTHQAVQSGLYYGYYHLISGLMTDYRRIAPNSTLIGTGSGLELYTEIIRFDHFIPTLIFEGLSYFETTCLCNNAVLPPSSETTP